MRLSIGVTLFSAIFGVATGFAPATRKNAFQTSSSSSSSSLFATAGKRTLVDKIWDDHLVDDDGVSSLIYIDRHLVHEVTSPQAFEGLRLASRQMPIRL